MISIIVPIYNVNGYLPATLDSILRSTVTDYELILVDDGSTDGSGDVCDRYAASDSRIRVLHKANAGVSEARNSGLEAARGEYIMFVDGDDQIHPLMMEWLLKAIQGGDYDFAMVHGIKVKEDEVKALEERRNLVMPAPKTLSQRDYVSRMFAINFQYQVVWNKLYRRSLIEGQTFRNTGAEDLEWLNRMALKMNKAVLLEEEMYYYIKRHNSLMRSGITMAYLDRINSYKMCLDEIPEDRHDYRAMGLKAMYSVMLFIRRHAQDPEVKREARRRCEEMFKLTSNEFLHCPISPISKMRSIAGRRLPCLYDAVMRRVDARSSR